MGATPTPVIRRSLFSWIWGANTRLQILVLLLISVTVFARVLPLEMQKRIVNEAIRLQQIDLLVTYCLTYLAAVISASGLKYLVTVLQVTISQRTLARMRQDLYGHIISLPLGFFRSTQPGLVVSSLVSELALPANFVGMAVAVPVINLLTLLAFAGYLFWLHPLLAILSLAIYPLALFLIPLLQRRVNQSNAERVDLSRRMSDKIQESIAGIHEIHGNGAYRIENRKFGDLVSLMYRVRLRWDLYRAAVKVTNNFFTSLGPFVVFLLGGYLTIQGQLELGALVAFLSAQEKLYDPWKELVEFYQAYQDGVVTYDKTMRYFDAEPEHALEPEGREPYRLDGRVEVQDLAFVTGDGIHLLDGVNFTLEPGEHMALVGFSGSGKSTLALCIGQLYSYTDGRVLLGGVEVSRMSKRDIICNSGFISQAPYIFDGTIEENLLYACAARQENDGGSPPEGLPTLDDQIEVLQQTGLFLDTLRFGLNTILRRDARSALVDQLIRVRSNFQRKYGEALADYVEFFNKDRYLLYSSVLENMLFGAPVRFDTETAGLAVQPFFIRFLQKAALEEPLIALGRDLTHQTVNILGNLAPDAVFFEQSPISADELEAYKALSRRIRKEGSQPLAPADRQMLLDLALRFAPGRHKMVSLPPEMEHQVLEGRALFRDLTERENPGAFAFYEAARYIHSQTILNNIIFGKTKRSGSKAQDKILQHIVRLLIQEDLLETIVQIGMQFQVGSKGDKLSGGQRQKLAVGRALLKSTPLLIMDEATSALDNASQARIQNLLETRLKGKTTVIAVVHRLDIVKNYDKVAVMKAGRIIEMGRYDDLVAGKGALYELTSGRA